MKVSIAEAILWGEQLGTEGIYLSDEGFNRRGDSLGGATPGECSLHVYRIVSIAEAILWGEQLSADTNCNRN